LERAERLTQDAIRFQKHDGNNVLLQNRFVTQINDLGFNRQLDRGANLDLTSSSRSISLGEKLLENGRSVTITAGGVEKTVRAGDRVTAAEYIAVKQALSGGAQQLIVDAEGRGEGGTFDLNSIAATKRVMTADSLTISSNVTAVGDLDKQSSFRLKGDLNNFGSLYVVDTNGGRRKEADIAAANILNASGALISSNAFSEFGNQSSNIDLNLHADSGVTNYGVIESSGALSLSGGTKIENHSDASVSASHNIRFNAPQIENRGMVSSTSGSVTLESPATLVVDNSGGTIQALAGDINLRSPDYQGVYNTNISGGDLLSQKLNMYTGQGLTEVNVGQLTGEVTGSGSAAHVKADTESLVIGKVCLTGDPTFFNTGNIQLNGTINVGEALAILASGNITSTSALTSITARTVGGAGQNIFLAAGFALTTAGGPTTSPTIGPFPGTGTALTAAQTVTASTAGAAGGNVDLSGSTLFLVIDASASVNNQNGGNVQIVARANGANGGRVILPDNSIIASGGLGTGINGDIQIAGGFTGAGDAIRVSKIIADTGSTTGGAVTIRATNPGDGGGTTFNANGVVTAGGFTFTGALSATGGQISLVDSIAAEGTIVVNAGPGAFNLTTARIGSDFTSGSGNVALSSIGNMTLGSDIFTNGGAISLASNGNIVPAVGSNPTINSNLDAVGTGGLISIVADAEINGTGALILTGATLRSSGTTGGNITLQGSSISGPKQITSNNNAVVLYGNSLGNLISVGNVSLDESCSLSVANAANGIRIFGEILIAGTMSFNAANNQIELDLPSEALFGLTIRTNSLNLNIDTFDATSDKLRIASSGDGDNIGVFGGSGDLQLSSGLLSQILCNDLTIGAGSTFAAMEVGSADISSANIASYRFETLGNINCGNLTFGANNVEFSAVSNTLTTGDLIGTTGNVAIEQTTAVNIGSLNSSGDLSVITSDTISVGQMNLSGTGSDLLVQSEGGNITNLGNWEADNIDLSIPSTGTFNLASNGVIGRSSIKLTASQDMTGAIVPAANLSTAVLFLTTNSAKNIGAIGTPLQIGNGAEEVRLNSAGVAVVQSSATTTVKLGPSTSAGQLNFSTAGPLTVTGDITTTDGDIQITGASGTLLIEDGVKISANSPTVNGNIFIGNAINGGNKKTDKLLIGDNVQLLATSGTKPGGTVNLQLGALATKFSTLTKAPANVALNPINLGIIQVGKSSKPFTAGKKGSQPLSTITADNAIVRFSNTLSSKNMVLGGGVIIIGDPPPSPAPTPASASAEKSVQSNSGTSFVTPAVSPSEAGSEVAILYSSPSKLGYIDGADFVLVRERLTHFAQIDNAAVTKRRQ
jgi:autotransporter family porin